MRLDGKSINASPHIAVAFVRVIIRFLSSRRIDPEPLLTRAGISGALLDEEEAQIPLQVFLEMLDHAEELSGDRYLGLHLYEDMDFADLGLLGYAFLNAGTLGDYCKAIARYCSLYQSGTENKLTYKDDTAELCYRITEPSLTYNRHDSEMSVLFGIMFIRQQLGDNWAPKEVHFQHPAPSDTREYQRIIKAPVLFDQSTNRTIIKRSLLDVPIENSDQRLFHVLEASLEKLQSRLSPDADFKQSIKQQIASALTDEVPNVEQAAEKLHMSVRTLQRRLAEANITFSELIDETRRMLAEQYLEETTLPQAEIADLLGYSGSKAFYRAFMRWHGMTPKDYRKAH